VEEKPEPTIVVILMAGIGGLLVFFGFFFGLIGAIAVQGFLCVAFEPAPSPLFFSCSRITIEKSRWMTGRLKRAR
jgi:hypothetical protein